MEGRPLAVGAVGAGAGTVSSVLALLAQQALRSDPPYACDLAGDLNLDQGRLPLIFWVGLLLGLLLGIVIGGLLDLLYLWKQQLTLSVRNRLATLQIKGGRA